MRKIVGIYDCNFDKASYDKNPGCLGGSETWTIELINKLINMNYYVILFCITNNVDLKNNMEFYPCNMLKYRCSYQKFDYFISSRTVTGISDNLVADKIYVMCHDQLLIDVKYNNLNPRLDRVNKYCFISKYQHDNFVKFYKEKANIDIPDEKCMYIGNGINSQLYVNADNVVKKNQMVFSSRPERGLLLFCEKVFPIIKKAIPDFTVKVCHYGGDDARYNQIKNIKGIEFVGKLNKEQLAQAQMESKLWIYLYDNERYGGFRETFCITALENSFAGNAMVTVEGGAIPEIYNNYDLIYKDEDFETIANKAIEILKDDNIRKKYANKALNMVKRYTWYSVAMLWDIEFKS